MGNYKWRDCFNYELHVGDDVLIAMKDHGRVVIHSGIIHGINDERMVLTYNKWKSGKEVIRRKYINFPGLDNKLQNIYKLI